MDRITCAEFLNQISECDSLANLKQEVKQARNQLRKQKKLKKPCFKK